MTIEGAVGPGVPPLGSIYDLGYQGYTGPRLGRRHAVAALFRESLRATFGIGRGGRSKIAPFGLAGLALLPALVAVGIAGLASQLPLGNGSGEVRPIRYENYYGLIAQLLFTFAAAQAPELLGRDLRHHVLSLLFSRALRRTDYVLAKVGALVTALLIVQLLPQAIVFVGRALASTDVSGSIAADAGMLPAIIGQAALVAILLGAISLAIASFSARRSYATAAIIVAFIVPPLAGGLLRNLAESPDAARIVSLLSPPDLLDATNRWLFDLPSSSRVVAGGPLPAAVAVVIAGIALGVLVRRYQRVAA
jgi:ABC-2 type transport system permease protein